MLLANITGTPLGGKLPAQGQGTEEKSKMIFERYLHKYWLSIRDKRVLSWTGLFAIMGQQITLVCSPISIKLVEMTRADRRSSEKSVDLALGPQKEEYLCLLSEGRCAKREMSSASIVKRLVEYIKQYHCVGNGFFFVMAIQFAAMFYLVVKTAFHKYVTGSNKALAEFYADRYFPRLFYGYSDAQSLDTEMLYIVIFIWSFRLARLYLLVRNSIINRDGYRHITAQQSSFTSTIAFVLPVYDWRRFWHLVQGHRNDCAANPATEIKHIRFADAIDKALDEKSELELIYLHNPISFEECYEELETRCVAEDRVAWGSDWFVPEPIMRLDPIEFGWLVTLTIIGVPLAISIVVFTVVTTTVSELCALALENGKDSCMSQLPLLLFGLSRMVRIFDIIILALSCIPPQIEGADFYWDCSIMISRANKINEALEYDLAWSCREDLCGNHRAQIENRERLTQSVWLHVRLLRCAYQEFRDLRWKHTVYVNILLIGGGLLLSMNVKETLTSGSLFKIAVLSSFNVACSILMSLSLFFCILVESKVGIT